MTVEELINSDSLIVVDGEYTDGAIRQAYTEGYNEAMRWRDPKQELPDEAGCDFCRDEQGYTIGNMYVCDKCGRQVP